MFMQMKREVLRLGGYAREFFVSQTPELTQMADVVIDVGAFSKSRTLGRKPDILIYYVIRPLLGPVADKRLWGAVRAVVAV